MNVLEQIHGSYIHNRRVRVLARNLSALLPAAGQILDVGCGDGLLAAAIQSYNPGRVVTGIDVLVRNETHIPVEKFDGNTIPFSDHSFDALMLVDVLHHTKDPAALLREAARVTRQWIVIKDHTLNGFAAEATLRFMDKIGNCRHNVALPHNYWPKEKWFDVFETLGLQVRTWKSNLNLYPPPADWLFGRSLHFIAQVSVQPNDSATHP